MKLKGDQLKVTAQQLLGLAIQGLGPAYLSKPDHGHIEIAFEQDDYEWVIAIGPRGGVKRWRDGRLA